MTGENQILCKCGSDFVVCVHRQTSGIQDPRKKDLIFVQQGANAQSITPQDVNFRIHANNNNCLPFFELCMNLWESVKHTCGFVTAGSACGISTYLH